MKKELLLSVFIFLLAQMSFAVQPNRQITPGQLCTQADPDFDGYRYSAHVAHCARHVTHEMKLKIAAAYSVLEADWPNYEFDHLIPLNAGGSSSIANIWPQPLDEARDKDKVEQQTYVGLSNGTLTQAQAVKMIWDWIDKH